MSTSKYKAQDFIKAIPGSGGIISTIARRVGCEWHTAKTWIDKSPRVRQVYDDEIESIIDLAESILIKSIKDGDSQDAKWFLARKGKTRGYVERQEITGKDGRPVITVNWDDPNDQD